MFEGPSGKKREAPKSVEKVKEGKKKVPKVLPEYERRQYSSMPYEEEEKRRKGEEVKKSEEETTAEIEAHREKLRRATGRADDVAAEEARRSLERTFRESGR